MSDRRKIKIVKKDHKPIQSDAENQDFQEPLEEETTTPDVPQVAEPSYEAPPVPRRRFQKGYQEYQDYLNQTTDSGVEQEEEVIAESEYQTREEAYIPPPPTHKREQSNHDNFAKPIPWLKISLFSLLGLALIALAIYFLLPLFSKSDSSEGNSPAPATDETVQVDKNGFYIKEMLPSGSEKIEDILSTNMTLRDLLNTVGVPKADVNELADEGNKFSIRRLKAGDKYTLAHERGRPEEVLMMMIEPKTEPYTFYKLNTGGNLSIEKLDKQVELRENNISAIVEGTLGETFIDNNLNLKLISSIEEVLAWTIDLFDVGDGDRFKVLYNEEFVNGKSYRIDQIKALYFEKDGKPYYAFNYNEGEQGFYNEFGQSMKRSFLATPIKYGGVITSGFGLRTHPVTGHQKNHLGTDFAAPEGTPIQAVADGVISIATFKANNGNYVKIRHDKTYETQYLHMQKFADGIRKGSRVRQGDIIGYVGTTGLSTGPHVCYRFWKNQKQVNPLDENASSGSRIPTKMRERYSNYIESIKEKIKEINYF